MADFEIAFKITGGHEGGYANNQNDRGGETYKGIARKFFPAWKGWTVIDGYKSHTNFPAILEHDANLQQEIRNFFKENFWDELSLDATKDQAVATELYDTGVNCGTGTAAIFLQRVLNVTNRNAKDYQDLRVDGKIGPTTISILNNHKNPKQVLKLLNCLQGVKYIDICEHNPSQETFMNSWTSRIDL